MFDGFMSPWTMPSRCRAANAARQSRHDGDGDARLQTRLHRPGGDDHLIDVVPPLVAHVGFQPLEHFVGQQPGEVVAVDPFHFHHADAAAVHPIVNVEQIVLLDLGHAGGHLGHPPHRLVVGPLVFVAFGREDFQGHRQREVVGPAPLGQIHHALAARTQKTQQPMVFGPTETLLVEDFLVAAEQFVRATGGGVAPPRSGYAAFKESRS